MKRKEVVMHMEQMAPLIVDAVTNGKNFLLCPRGVSMLPTIRSDKDYVLLSSPDNLKNYDIVLFKRKDGTYALHRITKCYHNKTYALCGDNQANYERGITTSQIIAKVTQIHRNGGEKIINTTGKRNKYYALFIRLLRFPKYAIIRVKTKIKYELKKSKQ